MTGITTCTQAGIIARLALWVRSRQRELSTRVHAAGDERARQYGWEVVESTGRFGFGARTYRDPRFEDRRRQPLHGAAQTAARDHFDASGESGVGR
jgi:hypothetical protein